MRSRILDRRSDAYSSGRATWTCWAAGASEHVRRSGWPRSGAGLVILLSRHFGFEIECTLRLPGRGATDPLDPSSNSTGTLAGIDARVVWMP